MYHKKLFKVFAGLLLAIGITVIFLLPVFRADLDRNGLDRRTFAHMSAIIDAVYSGEYDVTLEKMNGYRLVDYTDDFREACRSMYEKGDYQAIINYYLEKGYSAHIPQKLLREWEKEGIK